MKLLIVDDEIYIVRALQKNIAWNEMDIDHIYSAFNVEKAKEILQKEEIDIIITDIEMPRTSGLDLLEWIRESGYTCKAVCLTCHDEFKYAQRAMRCQVDDYILKPIDFQKLREIVEGLVLKIKKERLDKKEQERGGLWKRNKRKVETDFWKELLLSKTTSDLEKLSQEASYIGIEWDYNQQFQLILFSVKKICKRKQEWEESTGLMQYILDNIAKETYLTEKTKNMSGWIDNSHLWVIVPVENTIDLEEKMKKYLDSCERIAGTKMVAYTDEICYGEELYLSYIKLMQLDRENVSLESGIFEEGRSVEDKDQWEMFYHKMRRLFHEKNFPEIKNLVEQSWSPAPYIQLKELILNVCKCEYEIYRFLEENSISEEMFWDEELLGLLEQALHSSAKYVEFLKKSVCKIERIYQSKKEEKGVILEIQEYIKKHVEERISREEIAKAVNFSVDYISKIYKKETGESLSEYIMEQKIEQAKEWIQQENDTIGNIATKLGYSSFSYFSEVFRRFTGVLPSEYKRICRTE